MFSPQPVTRMRPPCIMHAQLHLHFHWDCHCRDKSFFAPLPLLTMLWADGAFSTPLHHQFSLQAFAYLKVLCCKTQEKKQTPVNNSQPQPGKIKNIFHHRRSSFRFPWMRVARKRNVNGKNSKPTKLLSVLYWSLYLAGSCKIWSWKVVSSIKSSLSLCILH